MSLPVILIVYGLYRVSHLGALGLIMRPRRIVLPFWLSLIAGHTLFIKLLLKASSRRSDDPPAEADPQNILDDVLT